MKKTLFTSLLALSLSMTISATNLDNHKEFRGSSNIVDSQKNWHRELRLDSWEKLGASKETIKKVLEKITSNGKLRDEFNEFKPKFWTYEFYMEAQNKFKNATTYENVREASALFLIASYPNLLTKHELQSLKMSTDAYVHAEQLIGNDVKKININGTTAILHLPKNKENKKLPVILWTGGVDKPLVTHIANIRKYINSGYAVITFDMPGAGLNENNVMTLGEEDKVHTKVYNYVKNSALFNSAKIAVLSSSGAGIPLIEFAIKTPNLKVVVARCAVVDGVLTKPFLFKKIPLMTAQSFGVRIGADINNLDSFEKLTIPLSLKTKGYFDGNTYMDTPLLVINTKKDFVAMPDDMQKTANMSSKGIVKFVGEEGHCPNGEKAEQEIFIFIKKYI